MELLIEYSGVFEDDTAIPISSSGYSDILITSDDEITLLLTEAEGLKSKTSYVTDDYSLGYEGENTIAKLNTPVLLSINNLGGFGAVGVVRENSTTNGYYYHKLLIYEYQSDISKYLTSGKIRSTISNPIKTFDLNLINGKVYGRNLIGETKYTHLRFQPGAKLIFNFRLGNSPKIKIGEFYIDKTNYDIKSAQITAIGRNIIGKALKDQTFDENYDFGRGIISDHLRAILKLAKIPKRRVDIELNNKEIDIVFDSESTLLSGINDIFKTIENWKIEENDVNKIVIGGKNYGSFNTKRHYSFNRESDIFSRRVSRDDEKSYRRVCVKDKAKTYEIYKDIDTYEGWHIKANRTLHINMPDGLSEQDADIYASTIASDLGKVGKLETLETKLIPHLEPGDAVSLNANNYSEQLGVVTDITHTFGRSGFFTTLSIDSGGNLTRGRVSDYINEVKKMAEVRKQQNNPDTEEIEGE